MITLTASQQFQFAIVNNQREHPVGYLGVSIWQGYLARLFGTRLFGESIWQVYLANQFGESI